MTRRQRLIPLSILMMLTLLLAGCMASASPDWGIAEGEVMTVISDDGRNVTVHNRLSSSQGEWAEGDLLPLIGCNNGTAPEMLNGVSAATEGGSPITISGWLSHDKTFTDGGGKDNVAGRAIVMELVDWDEVQDWVIEDVTHVAIDDWDSPTILGGRPLGQADDKFPDSGWAVLGLIPASETVNDGFAGLNEWNRPIRFEGYLMGENDYHGQYGYPEVRNCELVDGSDEGYAGMFVVTSFQVGDREVVNADSGYQMGDIPIVGRVLYLMIVVLGGAGGAFGLFVYSTASIRAQAAADAKMMLTDEQIRGAREVAGQVREHEKATEHLDSRKTEDIDFSPKKDDDDDEPTVDLKAFDIGGMLGEDEGSDVSEFLLHKKKGVRHGASVVQTQASANMEDELADLAEEAEFETETSPSRSFERRGSSVVGSDDRDGPSRGRDGPSQARGRDGPSQGRDQDGPSRGRDREGPSRGRDGPSQGRDREGPSRGRDDSGKGGGGASIRGIERSEEPRRDDRGGRSERSGSGGRGFTVAGGLDRSESSDDRRSGERGDRRARGEDRRSEGTRTERGDREGRGGGSRGSSRDGGGRGNQGGTDREQQPRAARRSRTESPPPREEQYEEEREPPRGKPKRETRKGPSVSEDESFSDFSFD